MLLNFWTVDSYLDFTKWVTPAHGVQGLTSSNKGNHLYNMYNILSILPDLLRKLGVYCYAYFTWKEVRCSVQSPIPGSLTPRARCGECCSSLLRGAFESCSVCFEHIEVILLLLGCDLTQIHSIQRELSTSQPSCSSCWKNFLLELSSS